MFTVICNFHLGSLVLHSSCSSYKCWSSFDLFRQFYFSKHIENKWSHDMDHDPGWWKHTVFEINLAFQKIILSILFKRKKICSCIDFLIWGKYLQISWLMVGPSAADPIYSYWYSSSSSYCIGGVDGVTLGWYYYRCCCLVIVIIIVAMYHHIL